MGLRIYFPPFFSSLLIYSSWLPLKTSFSFSILLSLAIFSKFSNFWWKLANLCLETLGDFSSTIVACCSDLYFYRLLPLTTIFRILKISIFLLRQIFVFGVFNPNLGDFSRLLPSSIIADPSYHWHQFSDFHFSARLGKISILLGGHILVDFSCMFVGCHHFQPADSLQIWGLLQILTSINGCH